MFTLIKNSSNSDITNNMLARLSSRLNIRLQKATKA